MNLTTINNLIFCIEKLNTNGQSIHEKNNQLLKLNLLKKSHKLIKFEPITNSAINFIIKQSKKGGI